MGGIIIINQKGETLKLINKNSGLSNNNIHSLCQDKLGNLWAGTSNGIDKIELSNPLSIFHPDGDAQGTFYCIERHDNRLYFGSNNALYYTDLNNTNDAYQEKKYHTVPFSEGQVWGLNNIHGDLLMGHNNGAYHIKDGIAQKFSNDPGAWKFLEARNQNEIYVGTYEGVHIYKKQNGKWTFLKKLEGFVESSRIMISVKMNELWVSHPYRGVYKIEHDDEYFVQKVTLYDESKGLPSILGNYIFNINNQPTVTGKTGIYKFDRANDRFEIDELINTHIDNTKNVRRLFIDKNQSLWYVAEHETGKIEYQNDNVLKTNYPELQDRFVGGFENIFFAQDDQVLICSDEQILNLSTNASNLESQSTTHITNVHLISDSDSLLFGGYSYTDKNINFTQNEDQVPSLKHYQNALIINYSCPSHIGTASYKYALTSKNSDKNTKWSSWVNYTKKEYNNLNPGEYTFQVISKFPNSYESKPAIYKFQIAPPWYMSTLAKVIYGLSLLLLLSAIVFIPRQKFEKEKKILTSAKEESDAKLEEVQTEKLKAEIEFKNTELASSTMHLVQKNETINKIRHEIKSVSKIIKDTEAKKEIRKILSLLSDDERLEDEWDNFSYHFDQVHTDFLKRIASKYPQLTPKDKKLCAYLRMNLTTKEIAPLLNISVRGVEISRYRLRKKIDLKSDINLNQFMMGF